MIPEGWPPYPTVLLGAGRWQRVIKTLKASGTKEDARLAEYIERQIAERHGGDDE